MKGKYLTKNIVFFRECVDTSCGVVDKIGVEELTQGGLEEECHSCGSDMEISEEFVVKN